MKRIKIPFLCIFFSLCLFFTSNLVAQSQLDLTIRSMLYSFQEYEKNAFSTLMLNKENRAYDSYYSSATEIGDIKWNYFFGPKVFRFGVGVRLWTLGYQNAIYPIISFESELGDFVFDFNVGGGIFGFFGKHNAYSTEYTMLPELSIAYGFGKKKDILLGASVTGIITWKEKSDHYLTKGTNNKHYPDYQDYDEFYYYETSKGGYDEKAESLLEDFDLNAVFSIFIRLSV